MVNAMAPSEQMWEEIIATFTAFIFSYISVSAKTLKDLSLLQS